MSKKTPLYAAHVELNARMIDFNGWDMPVQVPNWNYQRAYGCS